MTTNPEEHDFIQQVCAEDVVAQPSVMQSVRSFLQTEVAKQNLEFGETIEWLRAEVERPESGYDSIRRELDDSESDIETLSDHNIELQKELESYKDALNQVRVIAVMSGWNQTVAAIDELCARHNESTMRGEGE